VVKVIRIVHHLAATAAGAGLVLAGCTAGEPTVAVGSALPETVVDAVPGPEHPEPHLRVAHADFALNTGLERFCRAHDSALRAVDAVLADDAGEDDAVAVLIESLEAVTSTLAADLRAAGSSLHPRVEPLVAAAEQTAAGAREALDADHDARHDYVAEQLAGASYLQPLVDDPDLYPTVTRLAACEDLLLGGVTAERRDADDRHR
jgi:hypothetical protein